MDAVLELLINRLVSSLPQKSEFGVTRIEGQVECCTVLFRPIFDVTHRSKIKKCKLIFLRNELQLIRFIEREISFTLKL